MALNFDTRLRLLLFCLLLGVYLLVYVPRPNSADGDAVLTVAANLWRHGSLDINTIAYADWLLPLPASRMGAFGEDGALYAKKAPTPSLALLPLVVLADMLPWLTTRASAMLLNPLVTAMTAVILYSLVRRLGYHPAVAFSVGLVYGVATFAIVYVKTLFGEPLAALLLLLAIFYGQRYSDSRHGHDAVLAGAALGLLVGVNTIYGLAIPVLGLYLALIPRPLLPQGEGEQVPRPKGGGFRVRAIFAFAAPILVALALLAAHNTLRFGSPFDSGYHFAEGEGFTRPILAGLYGLFVSPYRGVCWYNPILLLALPGWWMLRRVEARLAWLTLALVALVTLAFAGWWSWHGGIVWGPRFLLPVTPLLALWLAPMIDSGLGWTGTWRTISLRMILVILVTLSLGVQMLGVLYSVYPYVNSYLNVRFWTGEFDSAVTALRDEVLYTPSLSPIVGHLALLCVGWQVEPAWLASGVDGIHFLAALGVMLCGALLALGKRRLIYASAVLVVIGCLNVVAARQTRGEEYERVRALEEALQPPGTVVAATTAFGSALVDLKGEGRVIVMNAPTTPDDDWATRLWDYALRQGGRLWYVSWFAPAQAENWQERDLWRRAAFVMERNVDGHRALLFDLAPTPDANQPGGWRFGAVSLEGYGVRVDDDSVYVTLAWSTEAALDEDITWFVHLVNADGIIVAQQDRPPQGGYAPTSAWQPYETVIDRLLLPLSPNTDVKGWRLRVGWVVTSGERVPIFDADGQPVVDGFVILPLDRNRP